MSTATSITLVMGTLLFKLIFSGLINYRFHPMVFAVFLKNTALIFGSHLRSTGKLKWALLLSGFMQRGQRLLWQVYFQFWWGAHWHSQVVKSWMRNCWFCACYFPSWSKLGQILPMIIMILSKERTEIVALLQKDTLQAVIYIQRIFAMHLMQCYCWASLLAFLSYLILRAPCI